LSREARRVPQRRMRHRGRNWDVTARTRDTRSKPEASIVGWARANSKRASARRKRHRKPFS
jgi:hypothetical protein